MKQIFCLLPATALLFAACNKQEEPAYQQPNVGIAISSPAPSQVFSTGDTLHLLAAINSPVVLHGYTWSVVRKRDDSTLTETEVHSHGQNLSVSGDWVIPSTATGELTVKVVAEIDHDGHEAVQVVAIKVLP